MAPLGQDMWIGMSYESSFVWVDQTSVSYTNWGPYEPNGGQGVVRQSRESKGRGREWIGCCRDGTGQGVD